MRSIRDMPIRGKLTMIIMVTGLVALLLGGLALTARYAAGEQSRLTERLTVLAKVTASNTRAAVAFRDPDAARDTLAALTAEPVILEAGVFDSDGAPFARFSAPGRADGGPMRLPEAGSAGGVSLLRDSLIVAAGIVLDGEAIGTVALRADLQPLRIALLRDLGAFALIIVAAGAVAMILAARLQQIVSAPILQLAKTMRRVSRDKDYGVRADKHGDDEVGALIDGFNAMLEQIRARDEQLRLSANALENTGDAIMVTDARLRIVFVNRAFATMTGYARDDVLGERPWRLCADQVERSTYARIWKALRMQGCEQWHGELWGRRHDGEVFPQWVSISAVRDPGGAVSHYVFVGSDVSHYKRQEARLEYLAHHDALTGLPNRALFTAELGEALRRARRRSERVALMFVDLDHFKKINDSLGHAVGDELLVAAAARIKGCLRDSDMVARQGGDEFTVLLDGLRDVHDAANIARKIIAELVRPFALCGRELFISASVGVACYPQDGEDPEALLKNADAAMYLAKSQGRNSFQFHADGAGGHALEALDMTTELHGALARDQFVLHYQPRYDLARRRITGIEALIRWQHPERGLLPPASFIPLAEESGIIEAVGEWVFDAACRQLKRWRAAGCVPPRVAINLSARQFTKTDLVQRIAAILARHDAAPEQVEVEITESMMMQDHDRTVRVLAELHAMGIGIAIDDFGTGYSSLSYLKHFPIDYLKIDRSFIEDVPGCGDDVAITHAIIALARSLRLGVIAEGVETEAQRAFLEAAGCDQVQGYLFSKPLTADEMQALLVSQDAGRCLAEHGCAGGGTR